MSNCKLNSKLTNSIFLSTLCLMVSVPALAGGYIQAGSEYEYYTHRNDSELISSDNYRRLSSYNPYIRFSYRAQNSDFTFSGRILFKQYPYRNYYNNNTSTGQSGLYEFYVTDYIRTGDFVFRPGIGVRVIPYNKSNYYGERYEHQLRILPQFDYLFTPDTRLYLNGFFYLADSKGSRKNDRTTDIYNNGECTVDDANAAGFCSRKYSDWGYEFDIGVRHNINNFHSVSLGLHSYLYKVTNNYEDILNQITIDYQWRLGKLTFGPYTRLAVGRSIKLKSEKNPASNITLKQPYNRYGVRASYALNGRWTTTSEVYYQNEKMQNQTTGGDMNSRAKWYFKLSAQYSF